MATCPRCLGALTEDHRCPRAGRFSRLSEKLPALAIGAVLGGGAIVAILGSPPATVTLAAAALGGVLANALHDALRPHL
jgi:hypothetical protein